MVFDWQCELSECWANGTAWSSAAGGSEYWCLETKFSTRRCRVAVTSSSKAFIMLLPVLHWKQSKRSRLPIELFNCLVQLHSKLRYPQKNHWCTIDSRWKIYLWLWSAILLAECYRAVWQIFHMSAPIWFPNSSSSLSHRTQFSDHSGCLVYFSVKGNCEPTV